MSEVNLPEIDTTIGIWDRRFLCKFNQLATTSVDYIRLFGVHTTGDKAIDREMANQLIETYIPIADMVEYYKNNITIHIVNRSDLQVIYDLIEAHLRAWKYHLGHGLNMRKAPINDLIDLDNFANSIFGHTRYDYIGQDESQFARYLRQINILPKLLKETPIVESFHEDDLPNRNSFADAFKEESFNNRSWRRG